jgi:hypothetical protein
MRLRTNEEVRVLSQLSDLPLLPHSPDILCLAVELDENDPRLAKLYESIWEKYRLRPSPHHVVSASERHLYFGVRRMVTWSKKEINTSELLWLRASKLIATHGEKNSDQLAREEYVAKLDSRQNSGVQFGSLMPFSALAVAEPLRSQLLGENLRGLHLPPVSFVPEDRKVGKPLWAVRSRVVMPRPLNLLQGEEGTPVEPNTEWWCWWDDGGCDPAVLRYQRAEVEALSPFDIAITFERVGQTEQGACRQCIVTPRFREVMMKLNVKGVDYVPVELL